ncbi:MAG: hypothetical protein SGI74_10080 [Oligoflexia bacterium]|nr:hypothetical protein [Oligoflexia bacterium]
MNSKTKIISMVIFQFVITNCSSLQSSKTITTHLDPQSKILQADKPTWTATPPVLDGLLILKTMKRIHAQSMQSDDLIEKVYTDTVKGNPVHKKEYESFQNKYGTWEDLEVSRRILNELFEESEKGSI